MNPLDINPTRVNRKIIPPPAHLKNANCLSRHWKESRPFFTDIKSDTHRSRILCILNHVQINRIHTTWHCTFYTTCTLSFLVHTLWLAQLFMHTLCLAHLQFCTDEVYTCTEEPVRYNCTLLVLVPTNWSPSKITLMNRVDQSQSLILSIPPPESLQVDHVRSLRERDVVKKWFIFILVHHLWYCSWICLFSSHLMMLL